jgi:outer membrane cobalamin receptor
MSRRYRHPLIPTFAMVLILACAHAPQRPSEAEAQNATNGRRIVTTATIERSGASTAWEALQRTVPFFTFKDNNRGGTSGIEHRGRSSIVLRDQPMIVMDGVELNDFTTLMSVPASDIREIEILTGIDATTYYGTGASKGVIRIWTRGSGS